MFGANALSVLNSFC